MPREFRGSSLAKSLLPISLLLWVTLLAGCSSSETDTTPKTGTITGVVSLGPVFGANIAAYDYRDGTRGPLQGTTTSDGNGNFFLHLQSSSGPMLLEVSGGIYFEEASGTQVTLAPNQILQTVINYQQSQRQPAMLTPFTTLAAGIAAYQIEQGMSATVAIDVANQNVNGLVGFDVQKIQPRDITAESNRGAPLDDGVLYGLFNAAISQLTLEKSTAPSHDQTSAMFAEFLYDDIRSDGMLDGKRNSEVLQIGVDDISGDTYRQELAQSLLVISSSANNLTAVDQTVITPFAQNLASAAGPLFNGSVGPGVLDTVAPLITPPTDAPDSYSGSVNLEVGVTDASGIKSVEFVLRDDEATPPTEVSLGFASDTTNPGLSIDTTDSDLFRVQGDYTIIAYAIDDQNNGPSQLAIPFVVNNNVPSVSITSGRYTNQTDYTITGTINDINNVGIQAILLDGSAVEINGNQFSAPVVLTDGDNTFTIDVTDNAQMTSTQSVLVTLDTVAPTILRGNIGSNACKNKVFHYKPVVSDDSGFASVSATLIQGNNRIDLPAPDVLNKPNITINTNQVNDGAAAIEVVAVDKAGNRSLQEYDVGIDNTGPQINVNSPNTTAAGQYVLRGKAVTSGCAVNVRIPIRINGVAASVSQQDGTFQNTYGSVTTNRNFEIIATDELGNVTTRRFSLTVN